MICVCGCKVTRVKEKEEEEEEKRKEKEEEKRKVQLRLYHLAKALKNVAFAREALQEVMEDQRGKGENSAAIQTVQEILATALQVSAGLQSNALSEQIPKKERGGCEVGLDAALRSLHEARDIYNASDSSAGAAPNMLAHTYNSLGLLYAKKGNWKEAVESFEEAARRFTDLNGATDEMAVAADQCAKMARHEMDARQKSSSK